MGDTKIHQDHFLGIKKGWYIQTKQSFFNPEEMILMDFRIPQDEDVRFVYVLPVSENKALIEFT
ncbi:MAG: lycopene cyclase family protein, partial [Bacteroidota bacterium]